MPADPQLTDEQLAEFRRCFMRARRGGAGKVVCTFHDGPLGGLQSPQRPGDMFVGLSAFGIVDELVVASYVRTGPSDFELEGWTWPGRRESGA